MIDNIRRHAFVGTCSWHGASNDVTTEAFSSRLGDDGRVHNPTSSAIFVTAGTDIRAGEELKISYVGDALGDDDDDDDGVAGERGGDLRDVVGRRGRRAKKGLLGKWIDGGDCGCVLCGLEREEGERGKERERELDGIVKEIRYVCFSSFFFFFCFALKFSCLSDEGYIFWWS